MAIITKYIKVETKGYTDIINITDEVQKELESCKINNGIITIFVPGSTGGITTIEYEQGVIKDLKRLFEEIIPSNKEYAHNSKWGDNNGFSHTRAALLGPSICIPFINKILQLGTWQQIVFIDFDNKSRSRKIILQIIGE